MSVHELEKMKKKLEQEKEELTESLEEAEAQLEAEEAKVNTPATFKASLSYPFNYVYTGTEVPAGAESVQARS